MIAVTVGQRRKAGSTRPTRLDPTYKKFVMAVTVVVCERATGIVCTPDGRRAFVDQVRNDPAFDTLEAAERWCLDLRCKSPELECVVFDGEGRYVKAIR